MRKPAGWVYRYEIYRSPFKFTEERTKDWWHITHYFGRGRGGGVRLMDGDPGPDADDAILLYRAHINSVVVPVYIIRGDITTGPYFWEDLGASWAPKGQWTTDASKRIPFERR